VPSILISQALASVSATMFHQKFENVNLAPESEDSKIAFLIMCVGIFATILGAFVALKIPQVYLKTYIGLLVLVMGLILLSKKRFRFSWMKMNMIGVLSGFNKALTGGGFGPVVTSGQILAGKEAKSSIGITTAAKVPICMTGFLAYILLNGYTSFMFPIVLTTGALLATPLGALKTMELKENRARLLIGLAAIILGIFTLAKTFL